MWYTKRLYGIPLFASPHNLRFVLRSTGRISMVSDSLLSGTVCTNKLATQDARRSFVGHDIVRRVHLLGY